MKCSHNMVIGAPNVYKSGLALGLFGPTEVPLDQQQAKTQQDGRLLPWQAWTIKGSEVTQKTLLWSDATTDMFQAAMDSFWASLSQ